MYAEHFRLRKEPFSIAPDPRFLYLSAQHREALAHLLYGVGGGGGFVVLTGEIGAGKTTVCRCFLEQVPAHCVVAYIFNPKLTVPELLQTICEEFRIEVPAAAGTGVKAHVDTLNAFLLHAHAQGRSAVLIIDEAQSLTAEVLEQLRLLTNLETHERKLLQIILIGQPELRQLLAQPGMEQLAQRVIARYHLEALSEADTRSYVKHRLAVAGGQRLPFDREAMARLFALSGGVPRRVNLLADRALLGAYAQGRHKVDRATLERAAREVFGRREHRTPLLWAVAAGAATVAAGLALWSLWPRSAPSPQGATSAAGAVVAGASVPVGVSAALPAAVPGAATVPATAPATAPATTAATAAAAAIEPAGSQGAAATARAASAAFDALDGALAAAPSGEGRALGELARLWRVELQGAASCAAVPAAGLACYRSRGGLAALRQIGRPAVLALRAPERGSVHLLLVELDVDGATLQAGARRWRVALPALAEAWRGEFVTLWRPPSGWRPGTAAEPADSVRTWVEERLALAGQGDTRQPLGERVWAFQVASGLEPDGVAGPVTLMRLAQRGPGAEPRLAGAPAAS